MKKEKFAFGQAAKYANIAEDYICQVLGKKSEFDDIVNEYAYDTVKNKYNGHSASSTDKNYLEFKNSNEEVVVIKCLSDAGNLVKAKLIGAHKLFARLSEDSAKRGRFYIDSIAQEKLLEKRDGFAQIAENFDRPSVFEQFKNNMIMFFVDDGMGRIPCSTNNRHSKIARDSAKQNRYGAAVLVNIYS